MNTLERFRAAFAFGKLDRLPIHTFGGWDETYARWRTEGLPADWGQKNFFGEDPTASTGVHLGTNGFSPFFPRWTPELLQEDDTYTVIRDEHGRVLRRRKDVVSASIAEYLEFPVRGRADWQRVKQRMDPAIEVRYEKLAASADWYAQHGEDRPVIQALSGTFRVLWHLMGDEGMYLALYDEPEMIHDIMRTWLHMNVTAIDRIAARMPIHVLNIMEDMSGNTGMLISPAMFREFMMPYYQQLIQHVRSHTDVFGVWVDSDGDVSALIPLLLECGVQGMFPFEVQAHMDVVALRRQYGQQLVIRGGIDKRVLPRGRDAIDRELDRVLPIFAQTGGYFICLDHQAPPDVPLENYLYFLEKARTYTPCP